MGNSIGEECVCEFGFFACVFGVASCASAVGCGGASSGV